jgi:3-oxoadipate enol-lactonase
MSSSAATQSGFAEVNGAQLYYELAGAGSPVALLHAGIADSGMWDDQFAHFAAAHQVLRFDMRGFGQSSMPDEPYSLSDDLYGLLRQLGIGPAAIVGVSIGGGTAIRFAIEHPEMVTALVPVGAGLGGFAYSGDGEEAWPQIEAAQKAGDLDLAAELVVRMWVDGPNRSPDRAPAPVRDRVRAMERHNMSKPEPEHARPIPLDPPEITRLGEIRAPTLVIVGDEDLADIQRIADHLAAHIPGARKAVMHDTAHVPNMEKPEEFNRLVLDFLRGV